jgi:hypothetical protein
MPAAEVRNGFNMTTGAIAPRPAAAPLLPPPVPANPAVQQAQKIQDGMASIKGYNERMAASLPTGRAHLGTSSLAGTPTAASGTVAPPPQPGPAAARPGEITGRLGITDPVPGLPVMESPDVPDTGNPGGVSSVYTKPAPVAAPGLTPQGGAAQPAQDPFYAKLEGELNGGRVKRGGLRGTRQGARVYGGKNSGQLVSDLARRAQSQVAGNPLHTLP